MKYIISLILILSCYTAKSQTFDDYVNNWRGYNNTNVTTKTGTHTITPINVGGGIGDSLAKWIIALHDSTGANLNLQNVTDNGNLTTNPIILQHNTSSLFAGTILYGDTIIYTSEDLSGHILTTKIISNENISGNVNNKYIIPNKNATDTFAMKSDVANASTLQNVIANGDTSYNPAFFTDGLGHKLVGIGAPAGQGGGIQCGLIDSLYPIVPHGNFVEYAFDSVGIQCIMTNSATISSVSLLVDRDSLKLHGGSNYTQTIQVKNGIIADLSDIASAFTSSVTLNGALANGNKTALSAKFGGGSLGSTDTVTVGNGEVRIFHGSTLVATIGDHGGTPSALIGSFGSTGTAQIGYKNTTISNSYWMPDKGGTPDTFAMKSDIGGVQSLQTVCTVSNTTTTTVVSTNANGFTSLSPSNLGFNVVNPTNIGFLVSGGSLAFQANNSLLGFNYSNDGSNSLPPQNATIASGFISNANYAGTLITYIYDSAIRFSQGGAGSIWIKPSTISNSYISTMPNISGTIVVDTGANATALTTSVTVLSITTPELSIYRVGGYLNVTAVTTDVIQEQVTWTDENSVSQTKAFFPIGTTSIAVSTTGYTAYSPFDIRAKSGTTITISTVLTTSIGSITYDVGGNIEKLK